MLITIQKLTLTHKFIKNRKLIEVVDFCLNPGDVLFINGKNGSGKSTLINYLFTTALTNYVLADTHGMNVLFDGENLLDLKNKNRIMNAKVAYLNQESYFVSNHKLRDSLMYPTIIAAENSKIDVKKQVINQLVDYYLFHDFMNENALFYDLYGYNETYNTLDDQDKLQYVKKVFQKKKTRDLSYGQRKLVQFVSQLIKVEIMNSKLLVLDEPLNHLDPSKIKIVSQMIDDILKARLKTNFPLSMIIVSHLMIFPFIKEDFFKIRQFRIEQETKRFIEISKQNHIDHSKIYWDL